MIEESWDRRYGQLCVGINWELFPTKEDAKVSLLIIKLNAHQ